MGIRDFLLPHKRFIRSVIFLFLFTARVSPQGALFGHISVEDGLSNNFVNCILQDHFGFLWIGTQDGLNRFDGYDFKVFRNDANDSGSISGNNVCSLFEDPSGILWVGTNSGELDRYDYNNDKFIHWKIDSEISKENRIIAIYNDKSGSLWIGTYKNGLYRFNSSLNKFDHWRFNADDPYSLANNYVTSILEDNEGKLWISTYSGLNRFNPETPDRPFTRYFTDFRNPESHKNKTIWNLVKSESDPNVFWICCVNGVAKYNSLSKKFSMIDMPESKVQFDNSSGPLVEEQTESGKILWIATFKGGLLCNNLSDGSHRRFSNEENSSFGLSSNQLNYLLKDKSGVLWSATDKGLFFLSTKMLKFNNFKIGKKREQIDFLKSKNIDAIAQTSEGFLWIGSDKGLYCIKNLYSAFQSDFFKSAEMNVWSLAAGNSGNLWIGTYGQGIKKLDIKSGKINSITFKNLSSEFPNPSFNFVKSILEEKNGMLWIGLWGPGLIRMNPKDGTYKRYKNYEDDPLSLSYNDVWSILQDNQERIWIGTNGGGLNLFEDVAGGKFYNWSKGENQLSKGENLSDNNIYSMCESKKGKFKSTKEKTVLWIGTGNGLNKFVVRRPEDSIKNLSYSHLKIEISSYTVKNGLPDNVIKSIAEDENGNLWLGTNAGVSVFDIEKNKFVNYTASDGLIGNEFNSGCAFSASDGLMFFGSVSGLNIFDPGKIHPSAYSPAVLITGFQIFNQEVAVGKKSPLHSAVFTAREICLSYDQNVFSFQFSSLDFNSPQSNQYTYKMEGFDNDWISSGKRRYVTYTNLDPGKYIFKVRATNSDGVWSKKEASLRVIINPPLWKTGWAYALYIFLIVAGFFAIKKFQTSRTELRNELRMREFESKKLQELETLKSRFFANLSHEFRTPLMLIKGPIEQLLNNWNKDHKENKLVRDSQIQDAAEKLKMVQRNSLKLQELIDQLLELSQLEASSIPLKARYENLITLLRGMVSGFELLAGQKNIKLEFVAGSDTLFAWVDNDKLEKIINNLLSNAFKFTQPGGTVAVLVGENEAAEEAEIKIADTGIGIPDDQLDKIFNRFYQVDDSSRREFGGSGIGLSLVKELVDLHKWKISVRSEAGKGTEFLLKIPLNDSYLEHEEKLFEIKPVRGFEENASGLHQNIQERSPDYPAGQIGRANNNSAVFSEPAFGKSLILLSEDSNDVRKYLADILNSCYNIAEAENGEEGLKLALEKMPDLIITDLMMPRMDGLEFCNRIKSNWETSHIPVIMLTAKASSENKIEGLETGADDYLTKPFDTKELYIRIKNLLEQRKRLKEKFSKDINISADTLSAGKAENEFLQKAFAVTGKNLSNPNFNSEIFAAEMYVSRSQLHRKLIAVTGKAPGEFIRLIRLKSAARLLLEKKLSITQIAFEVGFSSPSHFTKAFHHQFGCLPSQFREY